MQCGLIRKILHTSLLETMAALPLVMIVVRPGDLLEIYHSLSSITSMLIWISHTTSMVECRITAHGAVRVRVWENGGVRNQHWEEVGFGDGFDTSPDPKDSMKGYSMSQEGYLLRWNLHTGERKSIRPAGPDDVPLRFNWNAGFAQDPFDAATIYYGSQFLHKSTDRGESWTTISPDLTTNNPNGKNN